MTVHVTHAFVSAKSDGADPSLVQPSNWNDDHVLAQLPGTVLGAVAGGSGQTIELPISVAADGSTIFGTTGSVRLAVGTTGQRPLAPGAGDERYNTTTGVKEYWNGAAWVSVGQNVPTGVRAGFAGLAASCPAGWVVANGNTIGDAASSATNRANADTQALFSLIFTDFTDANLSLKTSGGVVIPRSTYASAALAFAAHTQMTLPNYVDRLGLGAGGTIAALPGATGGASQVVLIEANLPPHTHSVTNLALPASTQPQQGGGASAAAGSTGPGNGTSAPFSILNPYIGETPIIKL